MRLVLVFDDLRGMALAKLLVKAGFSLSCVDKRPRSGAASEEPSVFSEASSADVDKLEFSASVRDAVKLSRTVITLLGSQEADEDVYLAGGGIFESASVNSVFIDLSTVSPRLSRELADLAAVHDHVYLDAPIVGSLQDIRVGHSRILAAGDRDGLQQVMPVIDALSTQVDIVGAAGAGMTAKLASQVALACGLLGLVEALMFAEANGLKKADMLSLLAADGLFSGYALAFGQAIISEDFAGGLDVRTFLNELNVALAAAEDLDLPLPGLETAQQLYDLLQLIGNGSWGIQSLALNYYDQERSEHFGLDWGLAQGGMDTYDAVEGTVADYGSYEYDDEHEQDCCHGSGRTHGLGHLHDPSHAHGLGRIHSHGDGCIHEFDPDEQDDEGRPPSMGSYFSHN